MGQRRVPWTVGLPIAGAILFLLGFLARRRDWALGARDRAGADHDHDGEIREDSSDSLAADDGFGAILERAVCGRRLRRRQIEAETVTISVGPQDSCGVRARGAPGRHVQIR